MKEKRAHIILLFIIGALLITYTAVKAYVISITHDEGQTFLNFVRYNEWWFEEYTTISANNHPLNSLLMILSSKLFGAGELALRLPNVLAHVGYLIFTGLISLRYRNLILVIAAFLLLNVNPFVLDFFSLARGYGISLCFLAGSIYYLAKAATNEIFSARCVIISLLLALIGITANLTLLNYFLALSGTFILATLIRAKLFSRESIRSIVSVILITGITLYIFIPVGNKLKEAGTLYFGADNGFWADTVNSLIICSLRIDELFLSGKILVIFTLAVAAIASIIIITRRKFSREHLLLPAVFIIILLCTASSIAQHHLIGTKFLLDRTGIFFIPLFMLLICELLSYSWKYVHLRWAAPLLSLAFAIHSLTIMNLKSVFIWEYEAGTKEMITLLEKEHANKNEMITIGIDYIHYPSITYYKITRNLSWLNKVNIKHEYRDQMDHLFLPATDPVSAHMKLVKKFPQVNLYKNSAVQEWIRVSSSILQYEKEDVKDGNFTVITDSICYNGKSCGLINKDGAALLLDDTLSANEHSSIVKVHIKAMVFLENLEDKIHLTASTLTTDNTPFWDILPVRDHVNEKGKWLPVSWILFVPKPVTVDMMRAYFIGNTGCKVYFDDLQISAYTVKK